MSLPMAGRLDWMIFKGPFQTKPFCDPMKVPNHSAFVSCSKTWHFFSKTLHKQSAREVKSFSVWLKKWYKDSGLQRLSEIGTENALWKTQLHLKLNGTRLMALTNVGEILNWRLGKKSIQLWTMQSHFQWSQCIQVENKAKVSNTYRKKQNNMYAL